MRKPNYDKFPATRIDGEVIKGWQDIIACIVASASQEQNIAIELYTGVYEKEVIDAFEAEFTNRVINVRDVMKAEQEIIAMTERYMTDDVLFGYVTPLTIDDYFDTDKLAS
ncbi:MAG: mannose-6-phosphate isomerase, partial [Alistipes sp.]|nr:mannose-6-phosphate isomerase [Alistipes sp.]